MTDNAEFALQMRRAMGKDPAYDGVRGLKRSPRPRPRLKQLWIIHGAAHRQTRVCWVRATPDPEGEVGDEKWSFHEVPARQHWLEVLGQMERDGLLEATGHTFADNVVSLTLMPSDRH